MNLEFKKNRDRYEINVFDNRGTKSAYRNVLSTDPKGLAQILIDLSLFGFPVMKAVKIFNERMGKRDWLGL
jgi:hypothetical protein